MKFLFIFVLTLSAANAAVKSSINAAIQPKKSIRVSYNADEGQFPYQVAIYIRHRYGFMSFCAGSLISNEWILTAAHCTSHMEDGSVHLGATARRMPALKRDIKLKDIKVHPAWSPYTVSHNDIALIYIERVTFSDKVKAVKLPPLNSNPTYVPQCAVSTGWGLVSEDGETSSEILRWALFLTMSNDLCASVHEASVLDSHICAFTVGRITDGDVGAPLVLSSTKEQIGLRSFEVKSHSPAGKTMGYTRITSFLPWIRECTGVFYLS